MQIDESEIAESVATKKLVSLGDVFSNRMKTTLALTGIGFLAYLLILSGLPRPSTVMSITSEVEALTYRVSNPAQSAISIVNARWLSGELFDESEAVCVTGIVTPTSGTALTYRKYPDGLSIELAGAPENKTILGTFTSEEGSTSDIGAGDVFTLSQNDENCSFGQSQIRLPIWGATELGEEFRALGSAGSEPGLLLSGNIDVYGRSSETLGPFDDAAGLYSSGSIKLPTGSRVVETTDSWLTGKPWWGIARAGSNDTAFSVNATTEAYELSLYTPGVQNEPEIIQVGTFKRIYKDPGVLKAQVLVGILLLIFQTLTTLTGLWNWKVKE